MGKPLNVLDENFTSQKDARDFFYKIRDKYFSSKQIITTSREFDLLNDLYLRYCQYTNYPTPANITSFYVRNIYRSSGSYGGVTQGFVVTFTDNTEREFSADKAIKSLSSQHASTSSGATI